MTVQEITTKVRAIMNEAGSEETFSLLSEDTVKLSEYIENVIQGKQDAKDAVNVLADANLALTGSTPLVIDGITVTNGMRIGLVGQTAASANGIYVAAVTGPTYTLTRATDANSNAEVRDSGQSEKVAGYNARKYEIRINGRLAAMASTIARPKGSLRAALTNTSKAL